MQLKNLSLFSGTFAFLASSCLSLSAFAAEPSAPNGANPPGKVDVCWIGNTFSGNGGDNGFGYWVQNGADEIEVSPNGLIVAGCDWDEAGRCAGLYKDGKVNRVLLKQEVQEESAWGWNTGNHAVAVYGSNIYIPNLGKHLIRFVGSQDDLDSWEWKDDVELPNEPVGANANEKTLAVAYKESLELRRADTLKVYATWKLNHSAEIRDVVLDDASNAWLIVDGKIRKLNLTARGLIEVKVGEFEGLQKPVAIALDAKDRSTLIVCDEGPDMQVKFYDVKKPGAPKLVKTFGEKGGLFSKTIVDGKPLTDGVRYPTRFFGLHGAGTDLAGNLYVALGFNGAPVGGLTLRAFDPDGALLWENDSFAFVDTFGFEPESDGKRIYSRTSVFDIDPDSKNADLDWRHVATTIDALRYSKEEDARPSYAATGNVKTLDGKRLFYIIGQYGGGYDFYSFDEENEGMIARPVGKIRSDDETWAWHMDSRGDVWHGDYHKNRTIRRYKFKGWKKVENADVPNLYKPIYDVDNPDEWPWPEDFELVRRVIYDDANDVLYLSGYLKTDEIDSWGVIGKTIRKYEGWTSGSPKIAWTAATPVNPTGENGKPLTPQGLAFAGDYLFFGMVKPEENQQRTYVMDANTTEILGAFKPEGEIGTAAGWQDMPYSVAAMKRKNGDYLIMVEEDWRGKNIIYRWTPAANDK